MRGKEYPFDEEYQLPFPQFNIIIQNGVDGTKTEVSNALIDTGSDVTLVPFSSLEAINAFSFREARIRSHWGELRLIKQFIVNVIVGELTLLGILVVGDVKGDEIILGRDVLNKLRFELDGPARITRLPDQ
jgi:predicted aspartyl protease